MNSIKTEEVERLMRVVSESLRRQWEAKNYEGKSLVELQKSRSEATSYIESSYMKARQLLKWALIFLAVMLVCTYILSEWVNSGMKFSLLAVFTILILVASIIAIAIFIDRSLKKLDAAMEIIRSSDEVFERFKKSVDALNPLRLGNVCYDDVTDESTRDNLNRLAYRVIDAQVKFDRLRKHDGVSRYELIHLGNFINKAEDTFDSALSVAVNDFSLPFTRMSIYENAQVDFEKDGKRGSPSNTR